jgi:FtsZ-binding cell division protein ZapB
MVESNGLNLMVEPMMNPNHGISPPFPAYEPNQSIIWPSVAPVSIVLWSELYLRFVVENDQVQRIKHQVETLVSNGKELRSRVQRLRKQLADLKREYEELQGEQKAYNDNSHNTLFNGAK